MNYGPNFCLQIYQQEERELIQWLEMQRKLAEISGSPLPTRSVLAGIRQRLVAAFHRFVPAGNPCLALEECPCACPAPACVC